MGDVWYSGLRAIERRPIDRDDALIVDELRHDRLLRLVLTLAGPPILFALGVLASFLFERGELLSVAVSAAIVLVIAQRPWRTAPAFSRQLAALTRDMQIGEVLLCKGEGGELVFTISDERRLEPAGLVRGARDQRLEIEVLSESGAILRVNGRPLDSWSQMNKGSTAEKSGHAQLAAQFMAPHPEYEGVSIGGRALSTEELAELLAHATPLNYVDLALLFALGAVVFISWWYSVASRATNLALPILSMVAFVPVAFRGLRRWQISRRFSDDLRHGRVTIVSYDKGITIVEFLPFSRFVWSANHVAASWRRLPLWRKTFRRRGGA